MLLLFSETSILSDVSFVLCLDTVGNSNKLNLHVSKPPKQGSPGDAFYKVSGRRRRRRRRMEGKDVR